MQNTVSENFLNRKYREQNKHSKDMEIIDSISSLSNAYHLFSFCQKTNNFQYLQWHFVSLLNLLILNLGDM